MPGMITHTLTGIILSIFGIYYFKDILNNERKKQIILIFTSIFFSVIPDFFLGIYYTTHILPFRVLVQYHNYTYYAFFPIAIVILMLMIIDKKRKPYWTIGFLAIVFHLAMDVYIQETGALF